MNLIELNRAFGQLRLGGISAAVLETRLRHRSHARDRVVPCNPAFNQRSALMGTEMLFHFFPSDA